MRHVIAMVIVAICGISAISYIAFTADPFGIYNNYPEINSVEMVESFKIDDDIDTIQKEIGKGYEKSSLESDGRRLKSVTYKAIEDGRVKVIRLYYEDNKLKTVTIN